MYINKYLQICLMVVSLFMLHISGYGQRDTTIAIRDGSWHSASSWNTNRVPSNNTFVVIPDSVQITIESHIGGQSSPLNNMMVVVYGSLFVSGGQKIYLGCESGIQVLRDANIEASNNGARIYFCGDDVWRGGVGVQQGPFNIPSTLPVELIYFNVEKHSSGAMLSWATASEQNNDFFIIEKTSNNDMKFEYLATIQGNGNSNIVQQYNFIDNYSDNTQVYYRLSQYDFDGSYKELGIISFEDNLESENPKLQFQNPISQNDILHIKVNREFAGQISIFTIDGRHVHSIYDSFGTNHLLSIPDLSKGTYLIITNDNQKKTTHKLMVL
jgi:hypothetical protein